MSTLRVDLDNLKPGVRYSFRLPKYFSNRYEGTIVRFEGTFVEVKKIPEMNAQYIFENVFGYNKTGKLIEQIPKVNYANNQNYPQDIFVYTSNNLPGDLNSYINKFGGKSRKTKRRYNKKSKRRYNKKSKRR